LALFVFTEGEHADRAEILVEGTFGVGPGLDVPAAAVIPA
jgi:hypothetical protein